MDQGIVDAHHHLWSPERWSYPFLDEPEYAPIRREFGPDDLASTVTPHHVVQTIVVQAARDPAETEHLLDIAASTPLIAGVVGWVEFDSDDVSAQLDLLLSRSDGTLLRGVRAMAQDHPDPGWLGSDAVVRAARAVGAAGLVCELLIRPRQATAARALVGRLPDVSFVIDHAGKPPIASGTLEPWRAAIRGLAGLQNTACKVSGLITEASWSSWTADQIAPFADVVADAFGEDRLLFGSDWPVCLLAGDYSEVIELAREVLQGAGAQKVFAENARRVYKLSD